jgi:hypothetical protein
LSECEPPLGGKAVNSVHAGDVGGLDNISVAAAGGLLLGVVKVGPHEGAPEDESGEVAGVLVVYHNRNALDVVEDRNDCNRYDEPGLFFYGCNRGGGGERQGGTGLTSRAIA